MQSRRIDRQNERISGLRAERGGVLEQARILQDELEGLRELAEKGFYARSQVRAKERKLAGLRGRAGRLKAEIAAAQAAVAETEARIQQIRRSYREEVLSRLRESERDLLQGRERLKRARARLDRRYVLAEFAGTVHDLRVKSAGDVIRRGETILQLVPTEDRLIVEAQVAPRDIDEVKSGQSANVRITALSQRSTPVLTGRVVRVSADLLRRGEGEAPYYAARVQIPAEELGRLNADQRLRAGMPVEVLIKTDSRTLAEYLWKPVGDAISRGMVEP
ncbi:MAG: HlyD family type I secretion periplasmic adaptor subunit [Rhodovibrio sp.]|nr:HlyD family type I secretion periplasmic adaptor subunit [Rhodovibrio sp.]